MNNFNLDIPTAFEPMHDVFDFVHNPADGINLNAEPWNNDMDNFNWWVPVDNATAPPQRIRQQLESGMARDLREQYSQARATTRLAHIDRRTTPAEGVTQRTTIAPGQTYTHFVEGIKLRYTNTTPHSMTIEIKTWPRASLDIFKWSHWFHKRKMPFTFSVLDRNNEVVHCVSRGEDGKKDLRRAGGIDVFKIRPEDAKKIDLISTQLRYIQNPDGYHTDITSERAQRTIELTNKYNKMLDEAFGWRLH